MTTNVSCSILVVDDDVDIVCGMRDVLSELGFEVDSATSGTEAIDLSKKKAYDIALLDFKMPDVDGAHLYRELRRTRPELVAIMITAFAGSDGLQRALDAGAWKVMRKPIDFTQLLHYLNQARP